MERKGFCFDCKLAKSHVCDYEIIKTQITEAVGIGPEQRQALLNQQIAIAKSRGCPRIAGISLESPAKVSS